MSDQGGKGVARPPQDVSDAMLELLELLWQHGSATIRQLTDWRHPQQATTAQYATVQKLLERLEERGYVQRQRDSSAHVFEATIEREDLIGRRLRQVAEKLCGGSVTPLLTHLVRTESLTAEERQELRDLIDELDRKDEGQSEEGS